MLLIGAIIGATADNLPEVVLLEIFDCFLFQAQEEPDNCLRDVVEAWHTLVHVCQRWRIIVFDAPCRLNLRLYLTNGRPVKETFALWPRLPIIISQAGYRDETRGLDKIVEALKPEYNDRVCEISLLDVPGPQLEEALAAMQQPFKVLTDLVIRQDGEPDEAVPVVPNSFLGGSAQSLRHVDFRGVPFPRIPSLLLSATDLVQLYLWKIPPLGYFSPEAFVNCLSALKKLNVLWLGFESPLYRLHVLQNSLPIERSDLPVLASFKFNGSAMYLENLVVAIDAPLLDSLDITFFHVAKFDTPQLVQFISRTPNVRPSIDAHVAFSAESVSVLLPGAFRGSLPGRLLLKILCTPATWQLSSLAQVCESSLPRSLLCAVEHLYISDTEGPRPDWEDDIESDQWLEVLRLLPAVKDLYLTQESMPRIAPALLEPIELESVTELLPALQNLFLEEPSSSRTDQEAIEQFVAARQLAGRPIAVSHWDRNRGGGIRG